MKKIFILALIGALIAGCAKKEAEKTPLEIYEDLNNQLEEKFQNTESDEEIGQLLDEFIHQSIELIITNSDKSDAYKIAKDMIYVLETDQKEMVFNALNQDSLAAYGLDRYYTSFLAEKNTKVGMVYTDFETTMPDGKKIKVSDLLSKNDYLLIDFWASWCRPCRELMPQLKELYASEKGKLEILGVSLDSDRDKWLGAIETLKLNWVHGSDLKGWEDENAKLYGVPGIPCTILIRAADGVIISRNEHDIAKLKAIISL